MQARRVANIVAGLFLATVAGCFAWGAWWLFSGPRHDAIPTGPLVEDLAEFIAPAEADSLPTVVTECGGDGSFPAYAERTLDVGAAVKAAEEDLRRQAIEYGWTDNESEFALSDYERGSRLLTITAEPPHVTLRVETKGWC